MNVDHVAALESFVQLHARRLPPPSGERLVHLVHHRSSIPLTATLVAYSREDIASAFDVAQPSVQWLLEQAGRNDPHTTSMLGLIFDDGTILAHTIQRGRVRTADDDDGE